MAVPAIVTMMTIMAVFVAVVNAVDEKTKFYASSKEELFVVYEDGKSNASCAISFHKDKGGISRNVNNTKLDNYDKGKKGNDFNNHYNMRVPA